MSIVFRGTFSLAIVRFLFLPCRFFGGGVERSGHGVHLEGKVKYPYMYNLDKKMATFARLKNFGKLKIETRRN